MKTSGRPNAAPASRWASSSLPCNSSARFDDAHPASAAAEARLDDDRIPDLLRRRPHFRRVRQRTLGARHRRHVGLLRQLLGRGLVAEHLQQFRRRPDERDPVVAAGPGQVRVLREKPVPRMDRIDAMLLGDGDDRCDVQVPLDRLAAVRRPDLVRLIGLEAMQREAVFIGVNRDRPQPQLGGGAEDADGDLGPVGNQQFPHEKIREGYGCVRAALGAWAFIVAPPFRAVFCWCKHRAEARCHELIPKPAGAGSILGIKEVFARKGWDDESRNPAPETRNPNE